MTIYKIQIDDLVRDATAEEIAEIEARQAEIANQELDEAKATADRENAKQAVLAKLGLTADEVAALLA